MTFARKASGLVRGLSMFDAFAMKAYKTIQKPLIVLALGGPLILALVCSFSSRASFISYGNHRAAKYHSVDYRHFIGAVGAGTGAPVPVTWSWSRRSG
jgi:hypothetical protein